MERKFRVSFILTDEGLVPEAEAISVIQDVVNARLTSDTPGNWEGFQSHEISTVSVTRIERELFCSACIGGSCYRHVDEFLTSDDKVQKCMCPDPGKRHGKLPPKQR